MGTLLVSHALVCTLFFNLFLVFKKCMNFFLQILGYYAMITVLFIINIIFLRFLILIIKKKKKRLLALYNLS